MAIYIASQRTVCHLHQTSGGFISYFGHFTSGSDPDWDLSLSMRSKSEVETQPKQSIL